MPSICFHVLNAYSLFNTATSYPYGGAEFRAVIFAKALALDPSWNVSFITLNHGQQSTSDFGKIHLLADNFYTEKGVDQKHSLLHKLRNRYNWLTLHKHFINQEDYNRNISLYQTKADIFLIFGISGLNKRVIEFCKSNKKKVVLSLASDEELNLSSDNFLGLKSDTIKYFIDNVSIIFCQNEFQLKQLELTFNKKGILLLNPMHIEEGFIDRSLDSDKKVIWIGKSNKNKNPELLIQLAKENPTIKFMMFCSKSEEKLHEKIKNHHLPNIIFIDNAKNEEIEVALKQAHILISTSYKEGFANVFLLAGKYSLPIISCGVDPNNYIKKNQCGEVIEHDLYQLNMSFHSILDNNEKYKICAQNHYNYVQNNHSAKKVVPFFKSELLKLLPIE